MEILKIAGIVIGLFGIILMYKFGMSPNIKKGSITYLYTSEEIKTKKIEESKKEKHYKTMNLLGFILSILSMVIGYVSA